MGNTTLKDIAKIVGTSISTVSRALNYKDGVSPELAEKIFKVAQQMNYPFENYNKKTSSTHTIGVIVPDISNPFFPKVIYGMESVLKANGYTVIVLNIDENPKTERKCLESFLSNKVSGVLSASTCNVDPKYYRNLLKENIPVVFYDRVFEEVKALSVSIDNKMAIFNAVNHLYSHGHRRIAFVSGIHTIYTGKEREEGFKSAIKTLGLDQDNCPIIPGEFRIAETAIQVKDYIKKIDVTAIVTSNNMTTIGVLKALKTLNLKFPEDVSLIGFDLEDWSDILDLTVVVQPKYSIGVISATMLLKQMSAKKFSSESVVLMPELIVKNSVKQL